MLWGRMVIHCGGRWSYVVEKDDHSLLGKMVICCWIGWS